MEIRRVQEDLGGKISPAKATVDNRVFASLLNGQHATNTAKHDYLNVDVSLPMVTAQVTDIVSVTCCQTFQTYFNHTAITRQFLGRGLRHVESLCASSVLSQGELTLEPRFFSQIVSASVPGNP